MTEIARVTVEPSTENGLYWIVISERRDQPDSRAIWGRYATQAEAELHAVEARAYLFVHPDEDLASPIDDEQSEAPMP